MSEHPALPPALLRRIGAALYGEPFQTRLADELEVSPRTMRRWLAGDMPVPDGAAADMWAMVWRRWNDLGRIVTDMNSWRPNDGDC